MATTRRTDDRRTLRTRAALRQALMALMTERGWDAIGVQEICERANIGRSTFYTHFPNKDALLSGGFDDLRQFLRQARAPGEPGAARGRPRLRFALGLMEHAYENRRVFRAMIGRRSGHVVQQRFRELIAELVDDELAAWPAEVPRAAAVRWLAGALFELLTWWLASRSPVPPEDLHRMFERMTAGLPPGGASTAPAR